jgi:hypothetical protein
MLGPVSAIGIARSACPDSLAEQPLPVDIFSLIEELRRSVVELEARTASVPDIYSYYLPQAVPAPVMAPAAEPAAVYIREQAQPVDKRQEPVDASASAGAKPARAPDNDIVRSGQALGRLMDDSAGLTYDMAEVERLINEAMRSSAADIPVIISAKTGPMVPSQEAGLEYIERPAPEVIVREKTTIVKEVHSKEGTREKEVIVPGPARLATVLTQGISLPDVIRKSTVEMLVMQTVFSAGVPAGIVPAATAQAQEPARYQAAPAALEIQSVIAQDAVPDKISTKVAVPAARITVTPVAQALDIARAFNDMIGSYLAFRGTPARRGDIKEGVTRLLLSLPEQKAVDGPVSGLFDIMAALQASGPKAVGVLQPVEVVAKVPSATAASLPPTIETAQPTILGDLSEIKGTMEALQDTARGLSSAIPTAAEAPLAAGAPAAEWPEYEGELSIIRASIARLQAAMEYLSLNVPTLADLVVIQKTAGIPQVAAPQAVAPVAVTIEGVQPKAAAPISLPDLSWVTREFGQMQGMIARIQVPMYAEGGLVQEPTLAFVGESEPEWIVPQSTWNDSLSKLNNSYSLLWSYIQDLGAAMDDTVGGVNEALKSIKSGGGSDSTDNEDIGSQINDTVKGIVDKYLGMVGLSVDTLMNVEKTAGVGLLLGVGTVALPYAKNVMFGEDEDEEKEGSSGGDDDKDEEKDDEEDFWDMIEDLDDAAEINDKRDGKFEPEEE